MIVSALNDYPSRSPFSLAFQGGFGFKLPRPSEPTQRVSDHANSQRQRKVTGEYLVSGYIFPVPESGPIRALNELSAKMYSALISFFPSLTLNPIRGDQLVHQEAVLGKNLRGETSIS
jgi:hypothetical protein